jgi:membrane protease YdiL (CAAX protease family)
MTRIARLAVVFEGVLAAFALGLGWLLGVNPLGTLRWSWIGLILGLVATVPPALSMLWSDRSTWPPIRRLREEIDRTLRPLFARCGLLDIALIGIAAGFGEELLFRGVVQGAVGAVTHPVVGLVVAGILFGVVHLVTPTYAVLAGVVGLYLGWLFLVTGNLLVPIVVHATYDVVALGWWLSREPAPEEAHRPPDRPSAGPPSTCPG